MWARGEGRCATAGLGPPHSPHRGQTMPESPWISAAAVPLAPARGLQWTVLCPHHPEGQRGSPMWGSGAVCLPGLLAAWGWGSMAVASHSDLSSQSVFCASLARTLVHVTRISSPLTPSHLQRPLLRVLGATGCTYLEENHPTHPNNLDKK